MSVATMEERCLLATLASIRPMTAELLEDRSSLAVTSLCPLKVCCQVA